MNNSTPHQIAAVDPKPRVSGEGGKFTTRLSDAQRARALRWLLSIARADNLPMPKDIQFGQMVSAGKTLRHLTLGLDEGSDVTGWAKAIDAATTRANG